jgi:hypothetical protein
MSRPRHANFLIKRYKRAWPVLIQLLELITF